MSFHENFPQAIWNHLDVEVEPIVDHSNRLDFDHWCVGFVVEDRATYGANIWAVHGEPAAIQFARLINKEYRRPQFQALPLPREGTGARGSYLADGGLCFRWVQQYTHVAYSLCPFHTVRDECQRVHCLYRPRLLYDSGVKHYIDASIRETA